LGWVRRLRFAAGVFALALAAGACSVSNPVVGPAPTPGRTSGRPASSPSASAQGTPRSSTGGSPGQTSTGSVSHEPAYADDGGVGAMARTYLRRSPATSMVVEVDWVSGRDPAQSALDHLGTILRRETDKPGGVGIERGNQIASGRQSWTVGDLVALEQANRRSHSGGHRATMWICYVDGSFASNANALAVSYTASSVAIFRDRLDDAASALVVEPAIERSVITHEAGHLLALVNIGYRSRYDHEDPQHPHHSNNKNSVMYWAVEDISIRNVLHGGPPDDFDTADRADLAMLRGA
jgi:hypothetical protein